MGGGASACDCCLDTAIITSVSFKQLGLHRVHDLVMMGIIICPAPGEWRAFLPNNFSAAGKPINDNQEIEVPLD